MATRMSRYRAVAPASLEGRRAERLFVAVQRAAVELVGGDMPVPIEAVLCDVSPFGCRLSAPGDYAPGERLALKIGGGMAAAATVVWSDGGVIGCRFDQAVSAPALRQLTIGRG